MKTAFAILVAAVVMIGCEKKTLPEATAALQNAAEIELISLEPDERKYNPAKPGAFHGWEVLGRTTLKVAEDRGKLVEAFESGIEESDGTVASCFAPRHGIAVQHDGKKHEFVICFQCQSFEWHVDGKLEKGQPITSSPQVAFDELLTKAGVNLAEKVGAP